MIYYVIADLHGRYDLLEKAIEAISEDNEDGVYKIITLGDYVDRGPHSNKIISGLIGQQEADNDFICLQGNHEAMMVETIRAPLNPDWWISNGGHTTLKSYGSTMKVSLYPGFPPFGYDPNVVPIEHVDWIASLPLFYETEKQVFIHAGIPQPNMNLPPSSNTTKGESLRQQMQWMLYDKRESGGWKGKHVVHGHHQFADGPHVWHGPHGGRTNLDCYAWHTGRLVVGVFDDTQGHALRYLEVLGDDYKKTDNYSSVQRSALD